MHLLTQSTLLQALGWSLFNSLWQMGLLWLFYQLFILFFSRSAARIRHGLALLLLPAGVLWSVLSFVSAYFYLRDGGGFAASGLTVPVHSSQLWQSAHSFVAAVVPYGSSLYLLVLGGLLLRYSYHYFYSLQLTRTGLSRIQPEFSVFVDQISRRMGIRAKVGVWLSSLVDVPVTFGFLKPVILLPLAMTANLTPTQVEAILVHELAHIRRYDFLLNMGVTLLEGLYFFNPFTRWLIAQLKKEREHCCDDLVLQFRYDPHQYVSALLVIARQAALQGQLPRLVMAAIGDGGNQLLLQRAQRILQQQGTKRPGARPFALLVLALLVGLVTFSPSVSTDKVDRVADGRKQTSMLTAGLSGDSGTGHLGSSDGQSRDRTVTVSVAPAGLPAAKPAGHPPAKQAATTGPRRPAPPAKQDIAGAETQPDEEDRPLPLMTAVADAGDVMPEELVAVIKKDNREYSMGKFRSGTIPQTEKEQEGQPFVPNSSFSFLLIDTLRPEEKLARLEEQTQLEIGLSLKKLQMELVQQQQRLAVQLDRLTEQQQLSHKQATRLRQQLQDQQSHLWQEYLQNIQQLQKKLNKTQRHITIVYI